MLFSSITFLYYFLPITLLLYFMVPSKQKNLVLFLASLFFYAWGEPKYVVIMLLEIAIAYICGLWIGRFRNGNWGKFFLVLSISINIGMLGYFKYADFFISNVNAVAGTVILLRKIALPIGISFYTFQIMSYSIDVYRGEVEVAKNPITLATYVALFPQLIAGPIVRYIDVERQMVQRTHSMDGIYKGARRFIIGLTKKILIANSLGELCNIFIASNEKSVLFYWIYAVAFTLHIYFDFSGYSDMAIGLGKIFGFDFPENFNYPYVSGSITEFWRRWHMTLGGWFRDYVYIPLGGNRTTRIKWLRNILVVWFLTGFWHGAAWNFIAWGLLYAVMLMIEKLWLLKYLKHARVWNHVYTLLIVGIGFVIFNAASMGDAIYYLGSMIGLFKNPLASTETWYYLQSYGVTVLLGCLGATPYVRKLAMKLEDKVQNCTAMTQRFFVVAETAIWIGMLFISTAYLVDGSFNPFLYFRF